MATISYHSCSFFFIAFVSVVIVYVGASKEFKVGGSEGWHEPVGNVSDFYSRWAGMNQFHVGDSLVFVYKNDLVLRVDKYGYYHCNTSHPIAKFNSGNSIFHLDKPGPEYFISGDTRHCKNGQRLLVNVMELHSVSRSPPSIANPPNPNSNAAPAPSSHSGSDVPAPLSLVLFTFFIAFVYFA